MNIEKIIRQMPYHDKRIYAAFIHQKKNIILYFFNKHPTKDIYNYDSVTAIIVNKNIGTYDMTLPFINQLNKYYGEYEVYNSPYVGKHYKVLIDYLNK